MSHWNERWNGTEPYAEWKERMLRRTAGLPYKPPGYGKYVLYQAPNGGNRILPVVYATLTETWLRADGQPQQINRMNAGHLLNTIKLLRESHNNLTGKVVFILGKIWRHYQNVPEIQAWCERLVRLIEEADIDDVYPVFTALVREQWTRDGDGTGELRLTPYEMKELNEMWDFVSERA